MKPENLPENLAPTSTEARYAFLKDRLLGADFSYNNGHGPRRCVLVFDWAGLSISSSLDASIDDALASAPVKAPEVSPPNNSYSEKPNNSFGTLSAVSPAQHDEGYVLCPVEPTMGQWDDFSSVVPMSFGQFYSAYTLMISRLQPDSKPE